MLAIGAIFFGVWLVFILLGLPGMLTITQLLPSSSRTLPEPYKEWPLVSIIVTACNEERGIKDALQSLLSLDYPHYEIIAINDRSTDGTGDILDLLAMDDDRIQAVHIRDLPPDWLGKNHALYHGAYKARGEWILFTDADVVFHPTALTIAMAHVLLHRFDHLALAPRMISQYFWLRGFIYFFLFNLLLVFRPQNAKNPKSDAYMGVGAFNLMKAATYQEIGTHQVIRNRPDDDLKLGELVKQAGHAQDFGIAEDLLRVEWYQTVPEMIRGLEKNTMAPFEYQPVRLLLSMVPFAFMYFLPFIGPFVTDGWTQAMYIILIAMCFFYFCLYDRFSFSSIVYFLLSPILASLYIYTLVRAAYLTVKRGGIVWRGTLYPLQMLRKKYPT